MDQKSKAFAMLCATS